MINTYKRHSVYSIQLTLLLSKLTGKILVFGDSFTDPSPFCSVSWESWINALGNAISQEK